MNHAQLIEFLTQKVSLVQHLANERLEQLVAGSRIASYEPQEAVIEFGDEADFLGVLLEGDLAVSVPGDGGQRQVLGRFHAGDTFGEMALMSGEKTMADCIAETRCRVLRIPVALFQSVLLTEPRAVQHISRTLADRFKQVMADPAKAEAAFRQSQDPYGLHLKGERPEKVLVINSGSSSLKYTFFDTANEPRTARGQVERIGGTGTRLIHRGPSGEVKRDLPEGGYGDAFQAMLGALTDPESGVIREAAEISVVGHRVVHGGERFSEAVVVNEEVLKDIEALNPLAPLHNTRSMSPAFVKRGACSRPCRTSPCSIRRSTTRCRATPISTGCRWSTTSSAACAATVFTAVRIPTSPCARPSISSVG
jgi:acetate kinase